MSRHATNGYSSYSTWAAALIINNTYWIYRELRHAMETAWESRKPAQQAIRHIVSELCHCGCLGMDTKCEGACPISRRSLKEIATDEWIGFCTDKYDDMHREGLLTLDEKNRMLANLARTANR